MTISGLQVGDRTASYLALAGAEYVPWVRNLPAWGRCHGWRRCGSDPPGLRRLQADPFAPLDIPQAEAPQVCRRHRGETSAASQPSWLLLRTGVAYLHPRAAVIRRRWLSVTLISAASHQAAAFGVEEVILLHSDGAEQFLRRKNEGKQGLHATE